MNKEIELLAPAGSFDALIAAVQNGANAIYIGGNKFGARAFAHNFDEQQLKDAVAYCHLRNVKVYVTVNTIYTTQQFEELIPYIQYLYSIHVDALIIQDMGLCALAKKYFPNIEIHMSTQASVRNIEGVRYFEKQGIDRVVLARELSIDEISNICHNCNIDIEVFVHGALCMSYSGQCLMSSMNAKRSGNKGECGQPCRLPYTLKADGKVLKNTDQYLLSPQDLCTIDHVDELIKAGIKSFKIEGRMKRPEYVGEVVRAYRSAIDAYLSKQSFNTAPSINGMKKMFNRGFQPGFIFNHSLSLASDIPGNRGIEIGTIRYYNKNKKVLDILLSDDLVQNDRIYFPEDDLTRTITKLYLKNRLVSCAHKGDIVSIELDKAVKFKQKVYKIYDHTLIQEHDRYLKKEHIKLPITMHASGTLNHPLTLKVQYKNYCVECISDMPIELAQKTPLDSDRLKAQVTKLGNTTFEVDKLTIDFPTDGIISIKEINNLRRKTIEALEKAMIQCDAIQPVTLPHFNNVQRKDKKLSIQVMSLMQLEGVNLENIEYVFVPFTQYHYNEQYIPYVPFLYDEKKLLQFIESEDYKNAKMIMVSDFGAYNLTRDKHQILSNHFNLSNDYALSHFQTDSVLSLEMSKKDIQSMNTAVNLYFVAYSKIVNMNMKHCMISHYHAHKKVPHCNLCKKQSYQLVDRMNKVFDIMSDDECNNYILHNRRLYIDDVTQLHVDKILLQFYNEEADTVADIIEDYQHILKNNKSQLKSKFDTFTGYFS